MMLIRHRNVRCNSTVLFVVEQIDRKEKRASILMVISSIARLHLKLKRELGLRAITSKECGFFFKTPEGGGGVSQHHPSLIAAFTV